MPFGHGHRTDAVYQTIWMHIHQRTKKNKYHIDIFQGKDKLLTLEQTSIHEDALAIILLHQLKKLLVS